MSATELDPSAVRTLFAPKSVAVVGASRAGTGFDAVHNFKRLGFSGPVACVNPKYDEVSGFPCYPSLEDVPFTPDAVVLAVSRERVITMMEAVVAKGAKAAVAFALGFAEGGDDGRRLQARLNAMALEGGVAVLGPNCQGLINFVEPVAMYMDSVFPYDAGRVGLIAQSGSVATALINNTRGVRWSHAVSSGNEAVVDAAAILEYYVHNDDVDVICAFLETIRRPDAFFAQCDEARARGKAVIVCKSGRTPEAQVAAAAHTGALAVPDRLVDAALRRHHVTRVQSLDELLETALAAQSARRPRGGRLAVLTASGGQIELVHDNLPGTGLSIEPFSEETKSKLVPQLADFLPPNNPLDWWGTADFEVAVPKIVADIAADPGVDIILQVGDFTAGPTGEEDRAGGSLRAARAVMADSDKLFVVLDGVGGAPAAHRVESALSDGILALSGFDNGLRALGHLVRMSDRDSAATRDSALSPETAERVEAAFAELGPGSNGGPLAMRLLEAAGIPVAAHHVVDSAEAAVEAASSLAFPLVAKIADEDVAHKTERGGVVLGIASADELASATTALLQGGARRVLVQEQITAGTELILGVHVSDQLGSFVMVGLGGIWTEILDDVQFRPVPLLAGESSAMLAELKGYRRLMGARGSQAADVGQLSELVDRLDGLAVLLGRRIDAIDINPLILTAKGAIAVDALIVKS